MRPEAARIWGHVMVEVNSMRLFQALRLGHGLPDARLLVWDQIDTVVTGDYVTVKKGS